MVLATCHMVLHNVTWYYTMSQGSAKYRRDWKRMLIPDRIIVMVM